MAMAAGGAEEREIFRLRKAFGRGQRRTWQLWQDPDRECGEWAHLRPALDEAVRRAVAAAPARIVVHGENDTEAAVWDVDPE